MELWTHHDTPSLILERNFRRRKCTMKYLKKVAPLVMMIGVATACYRSVEHDPVLSVSFELPDGWEVIYDEPGYTSVGLRSPTKDGNSPHVKLETVPHGTFLGSNEDAKAHIESFYTGHLPPGTQPEQVEISTIVLDGEVEAYAHVTPHAFWGQPSWETRFAFSAGGYVVTMYINDDVRLYEDELQLIVQSARVSEQ